MIIKTGSSVFDREQILKEAPVSEPGRQLYFCSRVREILKARFEAELASGEALARYGESGLDRLIADGAYATFHIETYGCQMNAKDSEKLSGLLIQSGFQETDTEDADFSSFTTPVLSGKTPTRKCTAIWAMSTACPASR